MNRRLLLDIIERVGWTFIQGATSTLILADFLDVDAWKAAAVGGLAAVLAFIKGLAASRVGSPLSAATLPALPPATGVVVGQVLGPVGEVVGKVTSETGDLVGTAGAVVGPVIGDEGEPVGEVTGPDGEAPDKDGEKGGAGLVALFVVVFFVLLAVGGFTVCDLAFDDESEVNDQHLLRIEHVAHGYIA